MRHLLYLLVLCLAFLCLNIEARESAGRVAENNDFYYNEQKQPGTMSYGSGMGDDEDEDGSGTDDDEDDDDDEGSATDEPKTKTCIQRLQEVRDSSLLGAYEPQCEEDGTYKSVQCHGSIGYCWCADSEGSRIESTQQRGLPNCDNMVYEYNIIAKFDLDFRTTVTNEQMYKQKIKKKLMTSFTKKFRSNDVKIMINSIAPGSVIVDFDLQVSGIQASEPSTADLRAALVESRVGPVKDFASTPKHEVLPPTVAPEPTTTATEKPMPRTTPEVVIKNIIPGGEGDNEKEVDGKEPIDTTDEEKYNVVPGAEDPKRDDDDKELKEEETNEIGLEENNRGQFAASTGLGSNPGLLAGVIGGAVVGLLFAVLLVMFIVYRMRKKDEGSYALDEPKSPRLNTYTKASNKEFYA